MTAPPGPGDPDAGLLRFRVPADAAGSRLDRFLADRVGNSSRTSVQKSIQNGAVTVNGKPARPGQRLRDGEEVCLQPGHTPAGPSAPEPEPIPLEIVGEEEEFLVVNKPPGMVVHPAAGNWTGTLVHALLGRGGPLAGGVDTGRPGIVHRLDKGTSGLLLVAKTDRMHRKLSDLFRNRQIEKRYLALVWGSVRPGRIDLPVDRHPRDRLRMTARSGRGRPSRTEYRPVESFHGFTLLEVTPETGRTHQIRVHFAAVRHPLVGDRLYGGERTVNAREHQLRQQLRAFRRPALHACELSFPHPDADRRVRYRVEPPADFLALLAELRRREESL